MTRLSETDLIINPNGSVYHLNLKPSHLSDTIISVGDPSRVHKVSSHFDRVDFEMNKREFITHAGRCKGKRIMVISSGMGTDNAEILMNELDVLANIDLRKRQPKPKHRRLSIIRIGTSASIQEDLRLGAHVLSEYAIGMDPLMHFYNPEQSDLEQEVSGHLREHLKLPCRPYCVQGALRLIDLFGEMTVLGNTVTCHGFYAPQGRALRVPVRYPNLVDDLAGFHYNDFWITNMEMETAGYYAMGRILGHEVISLNAIVANRARNKFSRDPNRVIDSLIRKVLDRI